MVNTNVHFMSSRLDWKTPKDFYTKLNEEFNFTFDPCPSNPTFDGLNIEWQDRNFCNPPYGRQITAWIKKGYEESLKGKLVVFLIPARPDTLYWHKYILPFNIALPRVKEIIWASGLIDGEGCIFIRKNAAENNIKQKSDLFDLGLKVTMTHRKTIYLLKDIFKRGHITYDKKKPKGHKTSWSWVVRSKQAAYVISQIYPFLITKKQEAFKALEFSTLKSDQRGRRPAKLESIAIKRSYYDLLRSLKKGDEVATVETEIRFIKGRLKFGNSKNSAPFPSCLVIFRGTKNERCSKEV